MDDKLIIEKMKNILESCSGMSNKKAFQHISRRVVEVKIPNKRQCISRDIIYESFVCSKNKNRSTKKLDDLIEQF